jgi:hypothetical protein
VTCQDALWHERVRPPNTRDTSCHFLALPDKDGQSPLDPKVQGSTPCASTIKLVLIRLVLTAVAADADTPLHLEVSSPRSEAFLDSDNQVI